MINWRMYNIYATNVTLFINQQEMNKIQQFKKLA